MGEELFVRVNPLYRIWLVRRFMRLRLFLDILWRVWDEQDGVLYRLSWSTAWEVSGIVWPRILSPTHQFPPAERREGE